MMDNYKIKKAAAVVPKEAVVYYSTIDEVNMVDPSTSNVVNYSTLSPRREVEDLIHGQSSSGSPSRNIPAYQMSYQSFPRQALTSSSLMTSALQPHTKHKRKRRAAI